MGKLTKTIIMLSFGVTAFLVGYFGTWMIVASAMQEEPKNQTSDVYGPLPDNCQYYDRKNPDGSCDNSDPCDPTTLHDPKLRGDCYEVPQTLPATADILYSTRSGK